jgi:hypothetical protein
MIMQPPAEDEVSEQSKYSGLPISPSFHLAFAHAHMIRSCQSALVVDREIMTSRLSYPKVRHAWRVTKEQKEKEPQSKEASLLAAVLAQCLCRYVYRSTHHAARPVSLSCCFHTHIHGCCFSHTVAFGSDTVALSCMRCVTLLLTRSTATDRLTPSVPCFFSRCCPLCRAGAVSSRR